MHSFSKYIESVSYDWGTVLMFVSTCMCVVCVDLSSEEIIKLGRGGTIKVTPFQYITTKKQRRSLYVSTILASYKEASKCNQQKRTEFIVTSFFQGKINCQLEWSFLPSPYNLCLISLPNISSLQGRSRESPTVLQPCTVCFGAKLWQNTGKKYSILSSQPPRYTYGGNS